MRFWIIPRACPVWRHIDDEAFLPSISKKPPLREGPFNCHFPFMQENLSIKFRKTKACSHEEGGDRKPSGVRMCAWGAEHKFISKEGKGFLLLLQASKYAHAGKHTYLGTVSGFCLRALLGNEWWSLNDKTWESLGVPLSIKAATFII